MDFPANSKISILSLNNSFHKLFKKLIEKKNKNESISNEIEWINNQIVSEDRKIVRNCCEILTKYGRNYDFGYSLNILLSSYNRLQNNNFDIVSDAIFNLLIQNIDNSDDWKFGITNKPHPAILFISESNAAKMMYLSKKIEEILESRSYDKFLRPVLLMVLCNETIYAESNNIWRSILESGNENAINEIIALRRINCPTSCLLYNSMLLLKFKKTKDIESLLLIISSTKYLAVHSMDPSKNLEIVLANVDILLSSNCNAINIVLFLIAEILQITSAKFLPKIINLLNILITQNKCGHAVILHMILDGLIQILAYPTLITKEMQKIEELVNFIGCGDLSQHVSSNTKDFNSQLLHDDANLLNAYDCCMFIEGNRLNGFKNFTMNYEKFYWTRNHLVLRGYLHSNQLKNFDCENWKIVLINLIEISKKDDVLKSSLIMPLLFELSQSFNPNIKVAILQNITELGSSSEVFSTIKALSSGMIRSMVITLHFKLWKNEPRIYPFLHKYLVEKSSLDTEDVHLNIVRAATIKQICDLKPHHGSDLVTIISEILNQSLESKNDEISASLAIDSITLLCQNHIISITSTWKAISLTTRYEKRPRVIKSLCNFFSIVPQFKRNNMEYEIFMKDIVSRIFYMIQWGDVYSVSCALEAFKSWNYETLTLDMIPDIYRDNIPLPEAPKGMEVSILDLEVPGECFVQLLSKVNPFALKSAGDLISHFMRQEIAEYRSGHYIVKEGQAEPINYKNLPKQSIVKAFTHFIIQQATTKKAEKIVDETILIESLNILSQKYARPLPPLNWSFLHELIHKGKEIRHKCIAVAAKQAVISGTAKRLIENFLINIDENCHEDIEIALDVFVDVCNGASNEILKIFFDKISTCYDELKMNEKILRLLNHEKDVTNRENLATIISTFINRKSSSSIPNDVIRAIPPNILNMIQLSSENKIKYRCEILKEDIQAENSVTWVNELLLEQFQKNEFRDVLAAYFVDLLIASKGFPMKKWLNEFIIIIQNKTIEKDTNTDGLEFLLDIFISSIISMSGYFVIKSDCEMFNNRYQLFPQSMELLSSQETYADVIGSVFEFIIYALNQPSMSDNLTMKTALINSLILCKNHVYFRRTKPWQSFLQIIIS